MLLFSIAVLVEFFYRGDYMSPLEVYDIEKFFNEFIEDVYSKGDIDKYFNKYDHRSKKEFQKIFGKKARYFLSTIRKVDNFYEVSVINERKMLEYYFIRFLGHGAVHKMHIRKVNGSFKIIKFI